VVLDEQSECETINGSEKQDINSLFGTLKILCDKIGESYCKKNVVWQEFLLKKIPIMPHLPYIVHYSRFSTGDRSRQASLFMMERQHAQKKAWDLFRKLLEEMTSTNSHQQLV
jgi:hypothetical protein